jgi:hypothetical protein
MIPLIRCSAGRSSTGASVSVAPSISPLAIRAMARSLRLPA